MSSLELAPSQTDVHLPWWQSFVTVATLELRGAELNRVLRWVSAVVNPVAYFGLLGVGLAAQFADPHYLEFIVPGVIVMQAISSMTQMIYRTVIERRWGLAALKLQSGLPWSAYLAGLLMPRMLVFAAQGLMVALFASLIVDDMTVATLILMVTSGFVACIFWALLGLVITGMVKNYQTRDFVVGLIVTPLAFAAPVFYSLDSAPPIIKAISLVNPITYQVQFVRSVETGRIDVLSLVISLTLLLALLIAARFSVRSMRNISFEA